MSNRFALAGSRSPICTITHKASAVAPLTDHVLEDPFSRLLFPIVSLLSLLESKSQRTQTAEVKRAVVSPSCSLACLACIEPAATCNRQESAPMPMIEANIDPSVDPNAEVARKALSGVLRRFENEELAEAWLVTRRWPSGVRCPVCDSGSVAMPADRRPMPYRCRRCRTQFSVKSHCVMRASKLPPCIWVMAFQICAVPSNPEGIDIRDALRDGDLPVTQKAAYSLARRILEAWAWAQSRSPAMGYPKAAPLAYKRPVQGGRPRRILPPLADATPEQLAAACLQLPAGYDREVGENEKTGLAVRQPASGGAGRNSVDSLTDLQSSRLTSGDSTQHTGVRCPGHSAYRPRQSERGFRRFAMEIKGTRRRRAHPCEGCGVVRDLTGAYPDGPLLCDPCKGLFTCTCCTVRDAEFKGRPQEYEGDPDEFVCGYCLEGCTRERPGSRCRFLAVAS